MIQTSDIPVKGEIPVEERDRSDQFSRKTPEFTEDDRMFEENRHEGMYETLQMKLGKTNLELHKIIAAL